MLHVNVASPAFAVAAALALLAGLSDAFRYTIPNRLTYLLMVLGLIYHTLMPIGGGWLFAVAGLLFGLLILLPFFVLGGMGAGDVKLLAGIGACVGLPDVVAVFLVFGSLAGTYSAAVLLARGNGEQNAFRSAQRVEDALEEDSATRRRRLIPLAPMMALALLILAAGAVGPWGRFVSGL